MEVESYVPYVDVLVVDDDAAVRRSVSEVVRSAGHSVLEAPDGVAALALLQSMTFGVMLLDLRMPRLSGFQVLELYDGPTRVVVLSADHHDATTMPAGTDIFMFLRKPAPPDELLAVVALALADPAA